MLNAATFQENLGLMLEEIKRDSNPSVATANTRLKNLGIALILGQQLLTPDEYQAALSYNDMTDEEAKSAIERCQTLARARLQ